MLNWPYAIPFRATYGMLFFRAFWNLILKIILMSSCNTAAATLIHFNFVIRNCTIYLFHIYDYILAHDVVRKLCYHGEPCRKTNSPSLKHDETTWCMYVPVTWVMMGSDSGLSLPRRYAIIHNNDGSILIGRLGTDFNEIWSNTQRCSYQKINLNMSSSKCYHCVSVSMGWYLCYVYRRVSTFVIIYS